MATRKPTAKTTTRPKAQTAKKPARSIGAKGYASAAWERVHLLSVELDALARKLGLDKQPRDPDGFDLVDAARELARLAGNHNRAVNPDGRTTAQEKDDWVALGGVGADLGNMADEPAHAPVADGVRRIAHEVCYLVCDFMF